MICLQGMAACENVIEHLAFACNVPVDNFRRNNFYKVGDSTHFGSILGEGFTGKWNVPGIWDRLNTSLDIAKRRADIDEFNSKNKWIKRGATLLPTRVSDKKRTILGLFSFCFCLVFCLHEDILLLIYFRSWNEPFSVSLASRLPHSI